MAILRKLRKIGNSTVVSIPKSILETLKADEGDNLEFVADGDSVVIRKQGDYQKEILDLSNEMFAKYDKTMRDLVDR
ncbi:AbrB/MazE/SpoVT family DNA-binding domain-containing protein [Salinicoccus hispanicus]|uniref:AbrB/MazE/SpoVT family DNA-binding domain-containing protein n=1 Tax=Salinicoccus hispanicus TaxID=157225 RepID=A0A6N8U4M1_9STAP|nr:AbrB/MazE/SpoVT family DNA-binding domain-containing protein [Salinicoccus hispanicus]MXQ52076.1 AbrB/MazE/SpoVT family DNA-binding domain-containing protein [Salinicoccus hispanicus]